MLEQSGVNPYSVILGVMIFGLILGGVVSAISLFLGPHKPNDAKLDIYECGIPVRSDARHRLSVKFYLTAILFILFDIETVLLYLWAVAFETLRWFGIVEVGLFLVTLVIGYVYIVRRGALKWE